MDFQEQGRLGTDRLLIIAEVGPIGCPHLPQRGSAAPHHIGDPKGPSNFYQFSFEHLYSLFRKEIDLQVQPRLRHLINATGVVIHTNLGRSPLHPSALKHMIDIAKNYSNLEYDLDRGERGSRYTHVEGILCRLSGAESGDRFLIDRRSVDLKGFHPRWVFYGEPVDEGMETLDFLLIRSVLIILKKFIRMNRVGHSSSFFSQTVDML